MRPETQDFLDRLQGVKEVAGGTRWKALCPGHPDHHPSLDIEEGREGVLVTCRSAGCSFEAICAAVDADPQDLFWEKNGRNGATPPPDRSPTEPVARYVYRDAAGQPVVRVDRYEKPDPKNPAGKKAKDFFPSTRVGRGWKLGLNAVDPPLYRLEEIAAADPGEPVIWVEGEKCADALAERGFRATTSLGGTGRKNKLPDVTSLQGKRVPILPDEDEPGQEYAQKVLQHLQKAGARAWIVDPLPVAEGTKKPPRYDVADWLAEGHSAEELRPLLKPPPPRLAARLLTFAQLLEQPPPVWQVDDLILEESLVLVYGPTNEGKTFLTADLVHAIRCEQDWCGRKVRRPGPVLYVNADGGRKFSDRARAWASFHADGEAPFEFYTYSDAIYLHDPGQMAGLYELMAWLDPRPVFVVFDTYSRCIPGADENGQGEASLVIRHLDRLRNEYGATVAVLHHTNAEGSRERGSTVLRMAADTVIRVTQNSKTRLITAACEKQRDGERFAPLCFRLQPVPGTASVWPEWQPETAGATARPATIQKQKNQRHLIFTLREAGEWLATKDVAKRAQLDEETCRTALRQLQEEGQVVGFEEKLARGGRPRTVWAVAPAASDDAADDETADEEVFLKTDFGV